MPNVVQIVINLVGSFHDLPPGCQSLCRVEEHRICYGTTVLHRNAVVHHYLISVRTSDLDPWWLYGNAGIPWNHPDQLQSDVTNPIRSLNRNIAHRSGVVTT
jgi:hypothetical protein